MKREEKVLYLANVISVSAADREIKPTEGQAIEDIRLEIGAEKNELGEAIQSVSEGNYQMAPVGRLSDKIRNLEDMIHVSLSDGELSESERSEILSFAKMIDVSQGQINQILGEAKGRIKSEEGRMACHSCQREIPVESKFCPYCGSPIKE
jgi:Zn finger protein HypA/HybF involved in hydrogenase expression